MLWSITRLGIDSRSQRCINVFSVQTVVTNTATLNWYTPLGLRLVMSAEVVVGGKV